MILNGFRYSFNILHRKNRSTETQFLGLNRKVVTDRAGVIEPFSPPEKWLGGKTTIGAL